jgi:hypothetical protein
VSGVGLKICLWKAVRIMVSGSLEKRCFKIELELADPTIDYAVYIDLEAYSIQQLDDYTVIIDESTKIKFDEKIFEIAQTAARRI